MFDRYPKEQNTETSATKRTARAIKCVKTIWAELEYAQRRQLEITTGVPSIEPAKHSGSDANVDELEALFALELPPPP